MIEQDGEGQKFRNLFLAAKCLNEVRERKEIAAVETQLLERLKELTKYDLHYHYQPYGEEANLVNEIRTQAVSAIAFTWKDGAETLPWLKQCAQSDDNWAVRQAAVQEIARGWKDDPQTLPLLKQCAQSDDNSAVRLAAIKEIAWGWKDEPKIFQWLCDIAINDPFEGQSKFQDNPRQTALEIMLKQYPDRPKILEILRDRCANDPDEQVRNFAQKQLAKLEKL